jgi:hypothetical protein
MLFNFYFLYGVDMVEKQIKKSEAANDPETKQDQSAGLSRRVSKDMLFLTFAFLIVLVILFYILSTVPQPIKIKNETSIKFTGSVQDFALSLQNAEKMIIIENVSDLTSENAKYIYACGAGFAGSWGKIGKNISNLYVYVIDGDSCLSSTPKIVDNQLQSETQKTTLQCQNEIADFERDPSTILFYINYGPSITRFSTKSALILVDKDFTDECSFRFPETTSIPSIKGNSSQ